MPWRPWALGQCGRARGCCRWARQVGGMTGLRTPLSNCPRWSALDGMWCSMHARRPCEACRTQAGLMAHHAPANHALLLRALYQARCLGPATSLCWTQAAPSAPLPMRRAAGCRCCAPSTARESPRRFVCMCGTDGDSMGVMLHGISWCPLGQLVTTRDGLLHAAEVPAACRRQPMPSQG